jgi:hypothetical protein
MVTTRKRGTHECWLVKLFEPVISSIKKNLRHAFFAQSVHHEVHNRQYGMLFLSATSRVHSISTQICDNWQLQFHVLLMDLHCQSLAALSCDIFQKKHLPSAVSCFHSSDLELLIFLDTRVNLTWTCNLLQCSLRAPQTDGTSAWKHAFYMGCGQLLPCVSRPKDLIWF